MRWSPRSRSIRPYDVRTTFQLSNDNQHTKQQKHLVRPSFDTRDLQYHQHKSPVTTKNYYQHHAASKTRQKGHDLADQCDLFAFTVRSWCRCFVSLDLYSFIRVIYKIPSCCEFKEPLWNLIVLELSIPKWFPYSHSSDPTLFSHTVFSPAHRKKTRVRVWLYEDTKLQLEGQIIGFDEYMNMVLDDAVEVNAKQGSQRTEVGRILLKGDSITLLQEAQPVRPQPTEEWLFLAFSSARLSLLQKKSWILQNGPKHEYHTITTNTVS